MGRAYYDRDKGRWVLEENGHRVWSTDGRPVNLLPKANWISRSLTVSFPDFIKRNAYAFDLITDPTFGTTLTSAVSVSTILPGEWGPTKPAPRKLDDAVLGTVPAGVNFIDVRVKLSRTKAPSPVRMSAFVGQVPLDINETHGPGGSFKCEFIPSLYVRGIAIVLVGTNVVLRRYQSVTADSNGIEWAPGNAVYYDNGGSVEGWTYGGGSGADKAHLGKIIEAKGPGGNINKERGGSNGCSLNDTSDYSSTFSGSVVIRPGYIAA